KIIAKTFLKRVVRPPIRTFNTSDGMLQALPLCGVFGFCQTMAALAGGAVIVMQPTFEAEETALLIERHVITVFNGSDEMFARLLAVRSAAEPFIVPALMLLRRLQRDDG